MKRLEVQIKESDGSLDALAATCNWLVRDFCMVLGVASIFSFCVGLSGGENFHWQGQSLPVCAVHCWVELPLINICLFVWPFGGKNFHWQGQSLPLEQYTAR